MHLNFSTTDVLPSGLKLHKIKITIAIKVTVIIIVYAFWRFEYDQLFVETCSCVSIKHNKLVVSMGNVKRWHSPSEQTMKAHWDSRGIILLFNLGVSGFGGLGVACWPLVPKFAGSNAAEAVGFLGRKNPQHAFLRRGSKAVGPMS
jgi:hypothetical protein